ncbi:MAG TPA: nucleotidyltransferase family protein [Pyrinomonadaceae bacterium]|jgi:molybdenum cofactor cytidylyltransferase|nr:nucleotidyltransferase family protein [Pyrinomonadaceae bacterium]
MNRVQRTTDDGRRTHGVASIVLAAGRSRRMGAFKPLLPFGEKSVIESCVDNLRGAGVREIVVVAGHRAGELRERLSGSPVRFAVNDEAGSEMGASIARGVEQVSSEATAVLVALADHPAVPPGVIRVLIERRRETGARLILPAWRGRGGHPVLIDLAYREELSRLDAGRGLRGLFEAHPDEVLRVGVECPYVARDMDTWEDYRALHAEVFGVPPPLENPDSLKGSN